MTLGLGEYVAAMSLSRSDCFISTGFDMCSALRHGSALQFYLFMAGFDSTSRVGLCMFGASSVLSWLFSTQSAIENDDLSLSWPERSATRLASLLLIVIQTLSLASLCRPLARMNFFRWPARYLLGGYLLNVNFLDLLCLSPEVRR